LKSSESYLSERPAVGWSDWLDPLVGSKIISLHKLAFSYGSYAAFECVLSQIAVGGFYDTIISASALEEHKRMMMEQAASLE